MGCRPGVLRVEPRGAKNIAWALINSENLLPALILDNRREQLAWDGRRRGLNKRGGPMTAERDSFVGVLNGLGGTGGLSRRDSCSAE